MKEFLKSKKFQHILWSIAIFLCVLMIFQVGVIAGYNKAQFSYNMGEKYYHEFDGDDIITPKNNALQGKELPNQNGSVGKIVKISLPTILVADKDGVEKTISIDDDTIIRHFRDTVAPGDLIVGDFIVVIGNPNYKSEIVAKLIRVLPLPLPLPLPKPTNYIYYPTSK